ncbi:MAG: aminotransferase class V-fold PLP-dependent enzyme [Alphaproteobacteria bacterium]|nr:aminotransferase class V-fold PLP-dependent enzyme [Alphaproteobacteria bacterium]
MPGGVYLDYNARAPLRASARAAMTAAVELSGNPSSVHRDGRAARRLVEEARASVATLCGIRPTQIVFTSGGTEANATVLRGLADGRRILVSAVEHDSVRVARGAETVPVNADGRIDLDALDRLLSEDPRPALVAVMAVNNETGVIQPVAEAASLARRHGALLHCDAVQAPGRIALDSFVAAADTLTLSAHKIGGPPGCGALVVRETVPVPPLLAGGGQEQRRRAGTENLIGIAGFGAACRSVLDDPGESARVAALRDHLEATLRAVDADVAIYGAGAPRVGNTACLGMNGVSSETQVMHFDLAGIAVSAGAACSSGKVQASPVLRAMGVALPQAGEAIRVSLGWDSTSADVDAFVGAWKTLNDRTWQRRGGPSRGAPATESAARPAPAGVR